MNTPLTDADLAGGLVNPGEIVRAARRFGMSLLYRRFLLAKIGIGCAAICLCYFFLAPKQYRSSAQLWVEETSFPTQQASANGLGQQSKMPTHERLLQSDTVLAAAWDRLNKTGSAPTNPAANRHDRLVSLRNNLSAKAARGTNVIDLHFTSTSPQESQQILQEIVDTYLKFMAQHHQDNSVEVLRILEDEKNEVESELGRKQNQLVELRQEVGVLGLDEDANASHPAVQRVMKLSETIVDVQRERIELQSQLAAVEDAIRENKDLRQHLYAVDAETAQVVLSKSLGLDPVQAQSVRQIELRLSSDRARLQTVAQHYGPEHPKHAELVAAIDNAERFVANIKMQANRPSALDDDTMLGPMLRGMLQEKLAKTLSYETNLNREYQQVEDEVISMNGSRAHLALVQRDIDRLTKSYDMLLEKINGIDLTQNRGTTTVAVTSPPSLPSGPFSPSLKVSVASCMILFVVFGCGTVYLLEVLDDRFRTPEEMEHHTGAQVLTVVHRMEAPPQNGPPIHVSTTTNVVAGEAFRTLRTSLTMASEPCPLLAVSSSEPGDGKTTNTTNLAASFALIGRRTLLIDADLRKPGLSTQFKARSERGLSQLLREPDLHETAHQYIRPTGLENLDLISCGPKPLDPTALLGGPNMSDLLSWASVHYDQVLIDCPPLLVASDASLIFRIVDGSLLVVRPDKNSRRAVTKAIDVIRRAEANLLGLIVNFAEPSDQQQYYGYGEGYGYGYGYGHDESSESYSVESQPGHAPEIVSTGITVPSDWNRKETDAAPAPRATLRRRHAA
ncbi:MAG: polysaccharide biosynthesis tyrosine autokinase [Candidatus Paceibacterota bacterium]